MNSLGKKKENEEMKKSEKDKIKRRKRYGLSITYSLWHTHVHTDRSNQVNFCGGIAWRGGRRGKGREEGSVRIFEMLFLFLMLLALGLLLLLNLVILITLILNFGIYKNRVKSVLLAPVKLKKRVQVLEKLIIISNHLLSLKNFSGYFFFFIL